MTQPTPQMRMMLVTPVMRQPQMMQAKRPPERHLISILHQSIKRQPGHHPAVFLQKTQKLLTAPCSKIEQRSREQRYRAARTVSAGLFYRDCDDL
jgi:hypothetical protein